MSAPAMREDQRQFERPSSDFLLRLCHDLRACHRAIQPHAELLLRTAESGGGVETSLGFILDGARRLDSLVDGLAGYAIALQFDSSSFQTIPLDLVLRGVLGKLAKELRAVNGTVSHGKLPVVSGNPDRLAQMFEILIRNGLQRCGAAEPRIGIEAQPHTEGWLVSMRDNGPEFEDTDTERLFRPFENGMGLATCRIIVERHGGRIWADPTALSFTVPQMET